MEAISQNGLFSAGENCVLGVLTSPLRRLYFFHLLFSAKGNARLEFIGAISEISLVVNWSLFIRRNFGMNRLFMRCEKSQNCKIAHSKPSRPNKAVLSKRENDLTLSRRRIFGHAAER